MFMRNLQRQITKTYNDIFVDALKKAGYVFTNRRKLISFIEHNVQAKTFADTTTYYVNNVPFLVKKKKPVIDWSIEKIKTDFVVNVKLDYDFFIPSK